MSTLVFNLLYTAGGIALLVVGSLLTQTFIRGRTGGFDEGTMNRSAGTGVVPRWVSWIVLSGWFVVGTGVLSVLAAVLAGP